MKKHYKAIFFLLGVAGIVGLALSTNPDQVEWQELFTPRLPLLLAGLFALWAVIYAVHARAFRLVMGEAGDGISRLRLYKLCVTGFALNNVTFIIYIKTYFKWLQHKGNLICSKILVNIQE